MSQPKLLTIKPWYLSSGASCFFTTSPYQTRLALLIHHDNDILYLGFPEASELQELLQAIAIRLDIELHEDSSEKGTALMQAALEGEADKLGALALKGTPFQCEVWQALLSIPKSETVTYQELAGRLGKPEASRAVGTAIGCNPISLLIPCHRVIRKDGSQGGYLWGASMKTALLKKEGVIIS